MTFIFLFASFIFLAVLSAFIVFKFFRSRKTNSLLIVSQTGFENRSEEKQTKKKSIFTSRKKQLLIPAQQFILTSEEKKQQKLNYNSSFNSAFTSQMVLLDLAEYMYKNLRVSELLNATNYHAIPIESDTISIPVDRLRTLKLVTKEDFFSEKGFILLCTIAKYVDVLEIGSAQELKGTSK